jgi:2,4-dienoyl-CoA reductase (NADPH2)
MATGVLPRELKIEGAKHSKVLSYIDVLRDQAQVGQKVAVIGAGGIGFDVSEYLTHEGKSPSLDIQKFSKEWGIDMTNSVRGGINGIKPEIPTPARKIFLLQRKSTKHGKDLGKTTGWIHRLSLKHRDVEMIGGVSYEKIDDAGLHIKDKKGNIRVLDVDNVIVCAGQVPLRELEEPLKKAGITVFRIGGADEAGELDAKRAIDQGARLAAKIETAKPGDPLAAPPTLSSKFFKFASKYIQS